MSDLVAARRARLAALRERGVDPFTATRYDVTAHAAELAAKYADLGEQGRAESEAWSLAGRIMAVRDGGGVIFFDLHDRTGRFQLFVRKNDVGDGSVRDREGARARRHRRRDRLRVPHEGRRVCRCTSSRSK